MITGHSHQYEDLNLVMNSANKTSQKNDATSVNKALSQPNCIGQKQLQTIIESRLKQQMFTTPADAGELAQSARSFANDMGYLLNADAKIKGSQIAKNLDLRRQIEQLRAELKSEIVELRKSSQGYIQAAEQANIWFHEAETFVHKHPNIARMLHLSKK